MRQAAKNFQELVVWQKAHRFVLSIYRLSEAFPQRELYGLTSQVRRAAVSIPCNIAEGFKKRGHLDKARFLNIAQGSLEEARYLLMLAGDLGFGDVRAPLQDVDEIARMLSAYRNAVVATPF